MPTDDFVLTDRDGDTLQVTEAEELDCLLLLTREGTEAANVALDFPNAVLLRARLHAFIVKQKSKQAAAERKTA